MKDSVESRLGLFFAVAVIAALIVLEFAGGYGFFKRGYHLHAVYKNVQELKTGDFVRMAGVQIGRVEKILLTNGTADVLMDLQRDVDIKVDSIATLKFTGLMAQNYVNIDQGVSSVSATDGTALQTVEQPDLGTMMIKLDKVATGVENLTRSFSGEKIDNLLGPITDLIKNNQTNLSASIANVRKVTQNIADGTGTIGKLVNEDTLYNNALTTISNVEDSMTNLQDIAGDARTLLSNVNYTVNRVNSGQGTIGKLLKDDALYAETTGSMTNLHHILLKIDNGQGTVGQLINDDSTLKNIKRSMEKLDKATESLEDTGPLSILGTMVSSLF